MTSRPLAIDLFCGLGGWTDGLLAESWDVVGFDIERHQYGNHRYPAQLVIQDVLTLHGSQFKGAALIVASPPCQGYSYRAMPWKRAKALPPPDNSLFEACFRIQREACAAAGRHIPLIVENVRGAQKWVGQSRWAFGSYHLWGDVPVLMPITFKGSKVPMPKGQDSLSVGFQEMARRQMIDGVKNPNFRFDVFGRSFQSVSVETTGIKAPGMNWSDQTKRGQDFTRLAGKRAQEGLKGAGGPARKMASALIAKIPITLSRHIARVFNPIANPRGPGTT